MSMPQAIWKDRTFSERIKLFLNPFDGRYEDLRKGNRSLNTLRDLMAGLIVAMVAIPLAMGFAMASGLKPEQGIVGGAIAGLMGALFGGSKYQVYGPTAAFIPIIAAMMAMYPDDHTGGHAFLVLCSAIAGVILAIMGLARLGRYVQLVPHSIVVGFTIGIAGIIALSQLGEALGLRVKLGYAFHDKIIGTVQNFDQINLYAIAITVGTVLITRYLLRISVFIPAPLLAAGIATVLGMTLWADKGLPSIADRYGTIPRNLLVFTPPAAIQWELTLLWDVAYFTVAIIFVAAIESLLCSRMADRLANNKGLPYNPNKELWGQGWVNIVCPMINGFPHTGALARTATNIKVGAISPQAGIFKCFLLLGIAAWFAPQLEMLPMACIAGILIFVAMGMVKPAEVVEVARQGRFELGIMIYTAATVLATDFLKGVLSAMVLYAVLKWLGFGQRARAAQNGMKP